MARRIDPVIQFTDRPPPGPVRRIMDVLHALFGKVTSLVVVPMLGSTAGVTVTNAVASPGTVLATRTVIDFVDAYIDQVRLIVRGNNSGVGSVVVQLYDVTASVVLLTQTVTDAAVATYIGAWTVITPTAGDHEIEVRVIGDGAFDPIFYTIHLHGRTGQAKA